MDYRLEETPLEIKTDSELGSGESLRIFFAAGNKKYAGGFRILFQSKPKYYIPGCTKKYVNFPVELPSATIKFWRMTINRTPEDVQLVIHCNEQEALNLQLSDVCTRKIWRKYWVPSRFIRFYKADTASDMYRPYSDTSRLLLVHSELWIKRYLNYLWLPEPPESDCAIPEA